LLAPLVPHIDDIRIALTGGVAIGIHVDGTRASVPSLRRESSRQLVSFEI
jgi:hypothetical protein